jgi:hypothetical protein
MLRENRSNHLRVFVVWEPILPTDWSRPSRFVQRRILDSRAVQFWDKRHLVAKQLRAHLSDSQAASCSHSKILWDVVAVFSKDAKWDSPPVFIGGPVVRATPEAAKQLMIVSQAQR